MENMKDKVMAATDAEIDLEEVGGEIAGGMKTQRNHVFRQDPRLDANRDLRGYETGKMMFKGLFEKTKDLSEDGEFTRRRVTGHRLFDGPREY